MNKKEIIEFLSYRSRLYRYNTQGYSENADKQILDYIQMLQKENDNYKTNFINKEIINNAIRHLKQEYEFYKTECDLPEKKIKYKLSIVKAQINILNEILFLSEKEE